MGFINFSKANCQNCYSCVRTCPVGAVRVKNEQAEIVEERCITCGRCLKVCPKNAKEIISELQNVKNLIRSNKNVAISLAPSFAAVFGELSNRVCAALKKLGFTYVEETAVGAKVVTEKYKEYASKLDGKCYITSCCPSVNELIQKYHPNVIENLIPVVSPMECHGRIMKERYGSETKIVFIGPCLSKKGEASESKVIDAVLTFEELLKWFEEFSINLEDFDIVPFDASAEDMRKYPIVGGVTDTFSDANVKRQIIHVDGVKDCTSIIKEIENGKFKDAFIEMNLCHHGCIDGPAMPENIVNVYERKLRVKKFSNNCEKNNICTKNPECSEIIKNDIIEVDINKVFTSKYTPLKQPSEEEIKEILMRIGKYTKQDELNCRTCGYKTCRDKAIAVYNELAEPTMCLPFMKQKAETLSNVIFDVTPSIILIVNKELEIIDFNPAAEKFFMINKSKTLGLQISILLDVELIKRVIESKENIVGHKVSLSYEGATLLESAIWVEDHEAIVVVLHDITESEKQQEKLKQMKINTIEMTQDVINKQMRVAQEIASLLGETTAETKVSLTKLKKLVQGEEGEGK